MIAPAIGRREFITLLGGGATVVPRAAWAQPDGRMQRVGIFAIGNPEGVLRRFEAFRKALSELGWTEGRNVIFMERLSHNDPARAPLVAAEMAQLAPDVIFVATSPALRTMQQATRTIPIVFATVTDLVGQGFVTHLARPGGNITGFAGQDFGLATKQLELLKKIAPTIVRIAQVYDPLQTLSAKMFAEFEVAAPSFGIQMSKMAVRTADDIERALYSFADEPNSGLYVVASAATAQHQHLIITLTARHRLPAMYQLPYFVASGGLACYGIDDIEPSRQAASYVDRVLKGAKAGDLPVQLPTKFKFLVNLQTAKALGLSLSSEVLALADEVIE
jgi:putative ABC transport system substrate-binding protein